MARTFFRGASGCVIMFDVTDKKSFESAQEWKNELDAKVELPNGQSIPCVLLGNKVSHTALSHFVSMSETAMSLLNSNKSRND